MLELLRSNHLSVSTIMILASLLIAGGLYKKKKLDPFSAAILFGSALGFYILKDQLNPAVLGVLFISMLIGMMTLVVSKMPGGINWGRFILMLIALLAVGMFNYIDLLPQFLMFLGVISALIFIFFFR